MYEYTIKDRIWLKFEYLNLVHQAYCNVTCRLYRHRVQRGLRSRVGWGTKSSEKPKNQRSWDDQSRLVSSDWMIGWWFLKIGRMREDVAPTCQAHLGTAKPKLWSQGCQGVGGAKKKKGRGLGLSEDFSRGFFLVWKTDSFFFFFSLLDGCSIFSDFFFGGEFNAQHFDQQTINQFFCVGCIRPM